jgi:exonuclease VII small subunit
VRPESRNAPADAVKAFNDAIAVAQTGNKKLSYAQAAVNVSRDNPELHKQYLEATFNKTT